MNRMRSICFVCSLFLSTSVWGQVVPVPSHPPDGATDQPTTVTFRWVPVLLATSYDLQVSTTRDFTQLARQVSVTSESYTADNLSNGTTYSWRVRSVVLLVPGLWSEVASFTTGAAPQPPAAPTLSSPENGSNDHPTALALSWNASVGASSYRLQVSTSTAFSSLIVDASSLEGRSRQISGLSSNTTYYWRVNASNQAGASDWSSVWSFSTRAAGPGIPTLVSPEDGATNVRVPVTFMWNAVQEASSYRLQISSTDSFSSAVVDESGLTTPSRQVEALSLGATFYWRVSAQNDEWSGDWSTVFSFTTEAFDSTRFYRLLTTIDFPSRPSLSEYSPGEYKIIGIPGESNDPMANLLPGAPGEDWQAYWDNGAESNYWIPYDGGPEFVFSRGRAFWIINRGPWVIDAVVPAPTRNSAGEVEIPLHSGWNLITDPFVNAVRWSNIQVLNSTNEPLYGFTNGRYGISGYLEPYVGYYFFNGDSLTVLRIPSPESSSSSVASAAAGFSPSGWSVDIIVRSDSSVDRTLWFGCDPRATTGRDKLDVRKPRGIVPGPNSSFDRPQWDPRYALFASDIRPPLETVHEWEFTVNARRQRPMQISLSGIEAVPSMYRVILIDKQSGKAADLRGIDEYRFLPTRDVSRFAILVGKDEYVQRGIEAAEAPQAFFLGPNFPNPFNPSTIIQYGLSEAADVTLDVYNMLGQHVQNLVKGRQERGYYTAEFRAASTGGFPIASGVYFCRMTARTVSGQIFADTKRMFLVK